MKKLLIISICFLISACVVQRDLIPISGSKADGTILMRYEIGEFEKANVDLDKAKELATKKCKAWGYSGAEPFGGKTSYCSDLTAFIGCLKTQVSIEYQCLDGNASEN